jgi:hypothetical protein
MQDQWLLGLWEKWHLIVDFTTLQAIRHPNGVANTTSIIVAIYLGK